LISTCYNHTNIPHNHYNTDNMEQDNRADYPTPPRSVASSDGSSASHSTAPSSVGSTGGGLHDLKPYNEYLVPAKREKLAQLEFEIQMAEREIRARELEKSAQRFTAPKMKTYTLPFVLNEKQLKYATTTFPRTIFRCGQDAGHDHPLLHLETMIAADQAARLFPAGHLVVDVWGSPKRCTDLNKGQQRSNNPKRFLPYVSIMTEKDNLRALSWEGHQYIEGYNGNPLTDLGWSDVMGEYMFLDPEEGQQVDYMFIHTLYYVSDDDLAKMLQLRGSRAVAVVHRHAADSGTLMQGESTYAKINGCVEQINVQTGERYVHRDLSFLFTSRTKVVYTSNGAFTWTMHKVSDDTWIIVLTGCPAKDERFLAREKSIGTNGAAGELNAHALVPSHFPHPSLAVLPKATCTLVGGVPVIKLDGTQLPEVRVSSPEMLEFLCSSIAGKPRNAVTYNDLFSLARSHLENGTSFAGKIGFRVPSGEIAGHVTLAFLSGLGNETELLRAVACYHTWAREHHALLDMSAIVLNNGPQTSSRAALSVAKRVNIARKSGDLISGVLEALDS